MKTCAEYKALWEKEMQPYFDELKEVIRQSPDALRHFSEPLSEFRKRFNGCLKFIETEMQVDSSTLPDGMYLVSEFGGFSYSSFSITHGEKRGLEYNWDKDGRPMSAFYYVLGKAEGLAVYLNGDGSKEVRIYRNDLREGMDCLFIPGKEIKILNCTVYHEGFLHGPMMSISREGKINALGHYDMEIEDGLWYYENPDENVLESTQVYIKGELNGTCECNYTFGIHEEVDYKNNRAYKRRFYKDGRLCQESEVVSHPCDPSYVICEGRDVFYFQNGNILQEGTYHNDKKDGVFRRYFLNGQPRDEYTFKDGILDGPFKEWYDNGRLMREGTCKPGVFEYRCWDETGVEMNPYSTHYDYEPPMETGDLTEEALNQKEN